MTKEEYSAMDDTIATNMTIEQNWEENLSSLCSSEEVLESTDEDEDSSRSTSVITPGIAMHYLNELRDFALHHQNSELLSSIGQSALAVEKTSTPSMKRLNYLIFL